MTYTKEAVLDDLAAFADLGTDPPIVVEGKAGLIVRLIRESFPMELVVGPDGAVTERYNNEERRHANFRALLASSSLANLGRWADNQALQLRTRVAAETLTVRGQFSEKETSGDLAYFDEILGGARDKANPRVAVTLINGPAGIGKTSLIRSLAYSRANLYRKLQRPLVLHVESRGRVLQNITDLMAFSLQTLRLAITYDQIPALVRNGLVTLAIDGFDELGDPNGYDLAWAQVNDLVAASRGRGDVILAGRETFISKDRMEKALTALDPSFDTLRIFSLCPVRPADAKAWLRLKGWSEDLLESESVSPLFEEESYALRPFFLSELARPDVASEVENGAIDDLLSFLIDAMIKREATKFGRDIEAATTGSQRQNFLQRLMEEVARDLAENQSDAIPSDTLVWLAEIVASELVQPNLVGIFKNRAGVIAFLGEDERRGYRRFIHEQVANYFLSYVTVSAISHGETPKYIRRNIIGLEFLENFCSVFRRLGREASNRFFSSATRQMDLLGDEDRARRNLATLVLAACSVAESSCVPVIKNVSLDDVYLAESVSAARLESVTIAQLYAREADLRALKFEGDCYIASLVADEGTIPSRTFPVPSLISLPDETLTQPDHKEAWLRQQFDVAQPKPPRPDLRTALAELELFNLLARVARYKPFWLKDGEEKGARRILDDPNWESLKRLMLAHGLLVERNDMPAAGRPAPFYHVKNRRNLLLLDNPPSELRPFLAELLEENLRMLGM